MEHRPITSGIPFIGASNRRGVETVYQRQRSVAYRTSIRNHIRLTHRISHDTDSQSVARYVCDSRAFWVRIGVIGESRFHNAFIYFRVGVIWQDKIPKHLIFKFVDNQNTKKCVNLESRPISHKICILECQSMKTRYIRV